MPDRSQFRDGKHFAVAAASELVSPMLRMYARRRSHGERTIPSRWRRGLILGGAHIGDALYRTASLAHLQRELPECRWAYLTMPDAAIMLRGNPALHDILPLLRANAANSISAAGAAQLREYGFDVALCTDNIQHHLALRLALALGVPNRVAFASKGLSGLATMGVRVGRASWPAQIRAMIETVTGTHDPSPLQPRIYLDTADEREAEAAWRELPFADAPITIAASVTSRQALGIFPPALFVSVLRTVLEREPETRIILAGSRADEPVLQSIAHNVGERAIVMAGSVSLRAFAAVLSRCDAFLGSDSGPRHIANAVGVPVWFVRNMSVPEIEAGHYCESETDIAPPGQYLSNADTLRRLARVDVVAIAGALARCARERSVRVRATQSR